MGNKVNHIYIDTNVLIYAYLFELKQTNSTRQEKKAHECLNYLFIRTKFLRLFTSTLCIAQAISTNSKILKKRSPETKNYNLRKWMVHVKNKFEIVDFTKANIDFAISDTNYDIEDSFQYSIALSAKCHYIITENLNDFKQYSNVQIIRPKDFRKLSFPN